MSSVVIIVIVAVVVVALLLAVFKMMWRTAGPDEVLIVSRSRGHGSPGSAGDGSGLRVVSGRGTMVKPGLEVARRLCLAPREADLTVDGMTQTEIPVKLKGIVVFKVGDDYPSVAKAAGFADHGDQLSAQVGNVVAGRCGPPWPT